MLKVSIIVPTYNAGKFLDKTVESVLAQTFEDWELIIVDDFSKDATREIIKKWESRDRRIHSIFLEKNSGAPAHPKNVGMGIAKGEYIAYLDQDDEWLPEKLAKQVNIFDDNPQVGFLSCEAFIIDESEKVVDRITIPSIPENGKLFPSLFTANFMFSNSSLMLRREVIDHCGPRDESPEIGIAEDREYELRVAAAGYHFYVIHEPLFKYRVHDTNATKVAKNGPVSYLQANYKYIDIYEKYGMRYSSLRDMAFAHMTNGDTKRAREYLKMEIANNPRDVKELVKYTLTFFGKIGSIIFLFLVAILTDKKSLPKEIPEWQRDLTS